MGDFGDAIRVARTGEGTYEAPLDRAWEIWGPMGGYVASIALQAAAAESRFGRPASFFCHYLSVASFEAPLTLTVTPLRQAKTAESQRVVVTQGERAIMEATVWAVGEVEGLVHSDAVAPDVPDPRDLPTMAELFPEGEAPYPFWNNFDPRPVRWQHEWPPPGPLDPVWQQWERFVPRATFEDPWVDAARSVVLVDVASWPAGSQPHAWTEPPFIAPTLDLYVAFHDLVPESEYLLVDGHSPVGADGLLGFTTRVWAEDRRLVASGGGQMLCRRVPG